METYAEPTPVAQPVPAARPNRNPFITTRTVSPEPKVEPAPKVETRAPVADARPERVIPPRAIPKPEPKPDLISYADVAPARPAPSLIPPPTPPPVLPSRPEIEEKPVVGIPEPPKLEVKVEAPPSLIQSESNGTQVIGITSIMTHLYEMVPVPASLWVRTLAAGCDLEILAMAFLPIFAAYATLNTSLGAAALFILGVLLSALVFVYQAICLQIAERTVGMALLNLKLINTSDENMPITRQQMMLRAWGATLAFLCPPINLIIMKANRRGLSLPDLISGTSPVDRK